jgi:hypothetical protein
MVRNLGAITMAERLLDRATVWNLPPIPVPVTVQSRNVDNNPERHKYTRPYKYTSWPNRLSASDMCEIDVEVLTWTHKDFTGHRFSTISSKSSPQGITYWHTLIQTVKSLNAKIRLQKGIFVQKRGNSRIAPLREASPRNKHAPIL